MLMHPNKQPCPICKDHKPRAPFKIRDDKGELFTVTHICNCPYCGRYLSENYEVDEQLSFFDDSSNKNQI